VSRTLVLLRHGKSDWSTDLPDHDRPLAPRGRRQAVESGRWLAEHVQVDVAVVSTAVRARATWELAGVPAPVVRLEERVYAASGQALLAVVEEQADAETVLLVGHNPGLEDLVALLTGEDVELPTSAVAVVDLASGALIHHGRPGGEG
jgi:phosphohistidine phosphatase